MERLDCHCNNYQWGKTGAESEVARLFAAGHPDFVIEKKPYSELWMGTHPDGPARVRSIGRKLSTHIATSESSRKLSNNNRRDNVHLPFIMKVMSIDRTLSIQAHPTKEQAVRLHARDPVNYPDEHHKPELAYALTQFELLCGFRPAKEMLENLEGFVCVSYFPDFIPDPIFRTGAKHGSTKGCTLCVYISPQAFPPLRRLFGTGNCDKLRNLVCAGFEQTHLKCRIALAEMFKRMMDVDAEDLREMLFELFELLGNGVRGALRDDTVAVIMKMARDFPGDVGIFAPLYLNHMVLAPGECCYYAAEELHAYLSGECVECVGCSNNTIRAACTPKYIDREALIDCLNYRMTPPEEYLVPAVALPAPHSHVEEYAPDCKDFQLHRIQIAASPSMDEPKPLPVLECASITVFVAGSGVIAEVDENDQEVKRQAVTRGDIIYIPPGRSVQVVSCSVALEAYRTFSYEDGPDHDSRTVVQKAPVIAPLPIKKMPIVQVPATTTLPAKVKFGLEQDEKHMPVMDMKVDMDGVC
ncbi:hypothetical protein PRIPAC_75192 [Pristionchus pacificus]|uniref:mannose-6-phosphate isomerase n=1 Tax=Pristionchus pacificus TaxID=54126 RepID=A0A2A6C1Y8_PRIPA|nr:hypothetical protein PRIPAC_75192 [Pristionchus pacificus]|eukprot:PDM72041.1 hypothetical protein PRIPAC_38448 [Pristionchus pacificus]